jgi:hypothetical protein
MTLRFDDERWTVEIRADVLIEVNGELPKDFFTRLQTNSFGEPFLNTMTLEDILQMIAANALLGVTDVSDIQSWEDVPKGLVTLTVREPEGWND